MIEVNNLTAANIDEIFFKKTSGKILKKEKKSLELSIALVGTKKIKQLNKKYRKKDKITDILSFSYNGSGEIVICPQEVKKNAGKFGSTFKKELLRVLIHGILHLLGHNHEASKKKAKEMEKKQEYYFNLFLKKWQKVIS